jgi:hypothetical protein
MNQNKLSDENLRTWNEQQGVMKQEAEKRLASLLQQKAHQTQHSGQACPTTWIDTAIEREDAAVAHFAKSIAFADSFRALAQENRLHDPSR